MLTLYVLTGGIASGKSTYAEKLIRQESSLILLSSDQLRSIFGENEEDQTVSSLVFKVMHGMTRYLLKQGKSVILDATNKTVSARKEFIGIGKECGARIISYYFDLPLDICLQRNANRSRKVPEDIVRRFHATIVPPAHEEGFDLVLTYRGINDKSS
jgi:predicted kinase